MTKRPESVQVVVFADTSDGRRYLILRRLPEWGAFWQPVTGALEEDEEPEAAVLREVEEETGFARFRRVVDLDFEHTFEIRPDHLHLYGGATLNHETSWAVEVVAPTAVRISAAEHDAWRWCTLDEALALFTYPSNAEAFRRAGRLP